MKSGVRRIADHFEIAILSNCVFLIVQGSAARFVSCMDLRYIKLARQLVRYSTALKKGERILLDLVDTPEDMAVALIREVRLRKGVPFLRLGSNRLSREMLMSATDDQYQATSKHLLNEMKDMDAYIAIRGSHNITETSDVPAKKMGTAMKYLRKVLDHRVKRTKWCVLRWPHPAMAQQAGIFISMPAFSITRAISRR